MNELALFAGAGGGILGGMLQGWRTVAAVEIEDYPRRVLLQRQADGLLPRFPIWDDVRTFDGKEWKGKVDIITGGFPCQDISCAGKGAGIEGERSGMWRHMARIIREVRPRHVFVENSPMLVGRGLTRVVGDLAKMGYDSKWGIVGAHHVAAPHKRDRIWIVGELANTSESRLQGNNQQRKIPAAPSTIQGLDRKLRRDWNSLSKPRFLRSYNGVADGVDRIRAIGNGQVPAVAALAWDILSKGNYASE